MSPMEIAKRCAEIMWTNDKASKDLDKKPVAKSNDKPAQAKQNQAAEVDHPPVEWQQDQAPKSAVKKEKKAIV